MIVVLATPYFGITRRDGSFEIPNVAPGEYDLSVLHERATETALETLGRKVTVAQEALALPPGIWNRNPLITIVLAPSFAAAFAIVRPSPSGSFQSTMASV